MDQNKGLKYSNLSKTNMPYNVDMVAAISESAVNSQMRKFFSEKCKWSTQVFVMEVSTKNDDVAHIFLSPLNLQGIPEKDRLEAEYKIEKKILTDYDLRDEDREILEKEIEELHDNGSCLLDEFINMDIFSIKESVACDDNEVLKKAYYDYYLSYGINLEAGIDDRVYEKISGQNMDEVLPIIKCTNDGTTAKATFYQYFKTFEIFEFRYERRSVRLYPSSQIIDEERSPENDSKPLEYLWYFTCELPFDFVNCANRDIMDDFKKNAKVQNPDEVFNIFNFIIDFEKMQLDGINWSFPTIRSYSKALTNALTDLKEKCKNNEDTILGYIAVPQSASTTKYLFKPSTYNYGVGEKCLYLLLNFENNNKNPSRPSLRENPDFTFAPMLEGIHDANGAMIINANKMIPLIINEFNKLLPNLVIDHYYDIGNRDKIKLCETIEPKKINKSKMSKEMTLVNSDTQKYHWEFVDQDGPVDEKGIKEQMKKIETFDKEVNHYYSVSCDSVLSTVKHEGVDLPCVKFTIKSYGAIAFLNYGFSGKTYGTFYDKTIELIVAIKISETGEIEFIEIKGPQSGGGKTIDADLSGFIDWMAGGVQESIDDMADEMSDAMKNAENFTVDSFLNADTSYSGWFMPGSKTFAIKNENFSDFGDFTTEITYTTKK